MLLCQHIVYYIVIVDDNVCEKFRMNKEFGFTLAEVLITLAIIGIIATLTIPSLRYESNKQQWVSALAKNYKSMDEALKFSQALNGSLTNWEWEKTM